jgi:cytochrome c553
MKKILLSSIVAIVLLTGCGEDKKAESKVVAEVKQEVVKQEPKVVETQKVEEKTSESKLVDQVKESTSNVASKIVEESKKIADAATPVVKSVSEKVAKTTEAVTKEVQEAANSTKEKVTETVNSVAAKVEEVTASEDDLVAKGQGLYMKCAACHGANAQNPALGKSQIIKGWEVSKTVDALNGYKNDTYGGAMKGVMKSQVSSLSDNDIKALAAFISTL